jgi:hypothetical protein
MVRKSIYYWKYLICFYLSGVNENFINGWYRIFVGSGRKMNYPKKIDSHIHVHTVSMYHKNNRIFNGTHICMYVSYCNNTITLYVLYCNNIITLYLPFSKNTIKMYVSYRKNTITLYVTYCNNTITLYVT